MSEAAAGEMDWNRKVERLAERVVVSGAASLACDLPEHGLNAGDLGTVVLVHRGRKGYEVEFTSLDGETIAVLTLMAAQVRPTANRQIAHVRELAPR